MESLTLDREAAHLKDELMPKYANMVYNGSGASSGDTVQRHISSSGSAQGSSKISPS
jgi:argininosuccinate synthase